VTLWRQLHVESAGGRRERTERDRVVGPDRPHQPDRDVLDDIVDAAFTTDFSRGRIGRPYVVGGLLVCPGGLSESGFSHRCRFVSLDGQWCFEHPGVVVDRVRWGAVGPHGHRTMTSVTLVAVCEGTVVEAVRARIERGAHRLVEALRFEVAGGALVAAGRRGPRRPPDWPEGRERGGAASGLETLARTDELLAEIDELVGRPASRRAGRSEGRRGERQGGA